MFKKALMWYVVILVVTYYLVIVAMGFNNDWATRRIGHDGLSISGWNYELNEIDSENVKFTYELTLANNDNKAVSIRLIKPRYKNEVENLIVYDDYILVNKDIMPGEKADFSWDIVVNTSDIKNADIKEIRKFLTSIEVSVGSNAYHTFFINN